MNLHPLFQTSCLSAHYDLRNDWLYLDWQGELTLPAVQQACMALANCYLQRPYSHILNSNEQVTGVNWNVALWLATEFLPHMSLAGIQHVAWIYSPSLRGQHLVHTVLSWLPGSLITTFDDVADAYAWLKHTRVGQPRSYLLPERTPAIQAKLTQEVQALYERVAAQQRVGGRQRRRQAA
jgi:hypothetical protein